MSLNISKGNMYDFVTHTWNTIKGACPHDCDYCYMKRWGKLNPARIDEREFKTDLGSGKFIFVGSSNDLFADRHPPEWIKKTLDYCDRFDNRYLFQSKNPERIIDFMTHPVIFRKSVICTTIESDSFFPEYMGNTPHPMQRSIAMGIISEYIPTYVTIEPIMDFHTAHLVKMIKRCHPVQVNIGADSGNHHLLEPPKEKIIKLIEELSKFTTVKQKSNLKRLLK